MSERGLLRACSFTFLEERGFVNDPQDPGGATNMGITIATLREWRDDPDVTINDVRSLSQDEAQAIYAARYWNPVRADDLPDGIDLLVFDFGVTSGPGTSAKVLQRALGVTADGWIGDQTLEKAHAAAGANEAALIRAVSGGQGSYYKACRNYPHDGRGWMARLGRRESTACRYAGLPSMS